VAEFRMPVLGADMDEGTVLEWLVKPGDEVRKGDVIAVIDTAKSAIEVESFSAGTVEQLVVGIGETVPVGTVLASIAEPGEERAEPAVATRKARKPRAPAKAEQPAPPAPAPHPVSPVIRHRAHELGIDLATVHGTGPAGAITRADVEHAAAGLHPAAPPAPSAAGPKPPRSWPKPPPRAERQRVTPLARRLAHELGIDLAGVTGTGPDGEVKEADVRLAQPGGPAPTAAAAAPAARSAADRTQSMRQAIARLMARSKREIPHYYVTNTADMTRAMS
jgi:pyruvate dehydrogenase E2 component (dihydrolipoamide acetyltransferase)